MGTLDEKDLGEAIGKLAEGKMAEASALLTNVLVAALTAPALGPAALGAGKAAEGVARALANRISDSAIRRMQVAEQKLDDERRSIVALRRAIAEALGEAMARREQALEDLRLQSEEQFLQLVRILYENIIDPLGVVQEHVEEILELLRAEHLQGQEEFLRLVREAHERTADPIRVLEKNVGQLVALLQSVLSARSSDWNRDIERIELVLAGAQGEALYIPLNMANAPSWFRALHKLESPVESGAALVRNPTARGLLLDIREALREIGRLAPHDMAWDDHVPQLVGRTNVERIEECRENIHERLSELARMVGLVHQLPGAYIRPEPPKLPRGRPSCFRSYSPGSDRCQECDYAVECRDATASA